MGEFEFLAFGSSEWEKMDITPFEYKMSHFNKFLMGPWLPLLF